jgi:hypothetical protein
MNEDLTDYAVSRRPNEFKRIQAENYLAHFNAMLRDAHERGYKAGHIEWIEERIAFWVGQLLKLRGV